MQFSKATSLSEYIALLLIQVFNQQNKCHVPRIASVVVICCCVTQDYNWKRNVAQETVILNRRFKHHELIGTRRDSVRNKHSIESSSSETFKPTGLTHKLDLASFSTSIRGELGFAPFLTLLVSYDDFYPICLS